MTTTKKKNYTDKFIKIPVRLYEGFYVQKAYSQSELYDRPVPIDYVVGQMSLPIEEILGWSDNFESGRTPEEIYADGFDSVTIRTRNLGEIECHWTSGRFEDEINKFVEKNPETATI